MKLKTLFTVVLLSFASLLASNVAIADKMTGTIYTGKPYREIDSKSQDAKNPDDKNTASTPTLTGIPYTNENTPNHSYDTNLPELGDVSQTVMSALDEQHIGEQILRDIAVSDDVVQDVEITDYLQALGARLVSSGPDKHQKFNFFVVQDEAGNSVLFPYWFMWNSLQVALPKFLPSKRDKDNNA